MTPTETATEKWSEPRAVYAPCDCVECFQSSGECPHRPILSYERTRLSRCPEGCDEGRAIDCPPDDANLQCPRCADSIEPGWAPKETERLTADRYREIVGDALESLFDRDAWENAPALMKASEAVFALAIHRRFG